MANDQSVTLAKLFGRAVEMAPMVSPISGVAQAPWT